MDWDELMQFGDWVAIQETKHYASPDFPMSFVPDWELPPPPDENLRARFVKRTFRDIYPAFFFNGKQVIKVGRVGGGINRAGNLASS